MAEGFLREIAGDRIEALSAGSKPSGYVHPLSVDAMKEVGIDISAQVSKSINDFLPPDGIPPDTIVSVCSGAEKECPTFPGTDLQRFHWPFDDPADATGSDEEKMVMFRRVRDEIRAKLISEYGTTG